MTTTVNIEVSRGGRSGRNYCISTFTRARVCANADIQELRPLRPPTGWLLPVPDPSDCPWCGRDICEGCATLPTWMPPPALLDLAMELYGLGYVPLPLGADKRPIRKWGAWRFARPTAAEVKTLFNGCDPAGIGVVCGRPHDLVIVDADDEISWTWARTYLPAVRGTRTRRGGHLHFRHPVGPVVILTHCGKGAIVPAPGVTLDIKGVASYAVAPYSAHPSGHVYEPLGDWTRSVSDLPILPESIARLSMWKPRPKPAPQRLGDADDAVAGLAAYIRKRGGVPAEGAGSDCFVFEAAAWAKTNTVTHEQDFTAEIRRSRPEFTTEWVGSKWHSARGAR